MASIVNYFRQNGYNVIMDVMVSTEITSQGPTRWGESQIRKANKVLVFLSPGLINLALDGCEGFQSQVNTWYFSFFGCSFVLGHLKIVQCVGAKAQDGKIRRILITKTTMGVIFNIQNSRLLTVPLPTEVFQVNGQNRPVANLAVVDFRS